MMMYSMSATNTESPPINESPGYGPGVYYSDSKAELWVC